MNAEQTQIENVTKSLCWKKLVEKDDLAIWQKPTNHLHCKKVRKNYLPLCPAQDPDKAWYVLLDVLHWIFLYTRCRNEYLFMLDILTFQTALGTQIWKPV